MGKVNLFIKNCLRKEKEEYNIKGIYLNNKIKYIYNKDIFIIDFNNCILEKRNDNKKIILNFKQKECFIYYDYLYTKFMIDVIIFKILNNSFYVKYKIDNDIYEYKLSYVFE